MEDTSGNKCEHRFRGSPRFKDDALVVDREFSRWKSYDEEPPNHRFYTPNLDFNSFTVAIRFKRQRQEGAGTNDNILTGGPGYRWFHLGLSKSENLLVRFNNWDVAFELPRKIQFEKWTTIVCGVDLKNKTVDTFVDGMAFPTIRLADDFQLRVLKADQNKHRKSWCFVNPGSGSEFFGLVDEFAVFDGSLAAQVAAEFEIEALLGKLLRTPARQWRIGKSDGVVEGLVSFEKPEVQALKKRLAFVGIPLTSSGAIQYLSALQKSRNSDLEISRLILQLGSDDFQKRRGASFRLKSLGSIAIKQLEAAKSSLDSEIAFRAEELLRKTKVPSRHEDSVTAGVLKYLRSNPSSEAIPCLLELIGDCQTRELAIDLSVTLATCVEEGSRQQLERWVADKNSFVRLAAILCWNRVMGSDSAKMVLPGFLADRDELVRLVSARLLISGGEKSIMDCLKSLKQSPSFRIRYVAKSLTRQLEKK